MKKEKIMNETETARCSVCRKLFERSLEPERRYISCPVHSFGERELNNKKERE